jgi:hypothetical protein
VVDIGSEGLPTGLTGADVDDSETTEICDISVVLGRIAFGSKLSLTVRRLATPFGVCVRAVKSFVLSETASESRLEARAWSERYSARTSRVTVITTAPDEAYELQFC